jgi:signal peptidase
MASAATQYFEMSSNSMVPTLHVNDVITVDTSVPINSLQIGDIIVHYQPSNSSKILVSRIVDLQVNTQGDKVLKTKGDANQNSISGVDYPITRQLYIGKVVGINPQVGIIPKIFSPPVGPLILIGIVGTVVYFVIRKTKRKRAKTSRH